MSLGAVGSLLVLLVVTIPPRDFGFSPSVTLDGGCGSDHCCVEAVLPG